MSLFRAAYPIENDLRNLLNSLSLDLDFTNIDFATALDRSQQDFEANTNRVFLAVTGTKYFDPPTSNKGVLDLRADLLSCSSVIISGTTLVLNTDYWLRDYSGGVDTKPYAAIEFNQRWGYLVPSQHRAIAITGMWGFSSQVPALAWDAILFGAAIKLSGQLALQITGGASEFTQGPVKGKFGSSKSNNPFEDQVKMWQDSYKDAVTTYKRRLAF